MTTYNPHLPPSREWGTDSTEENYRARLAHEKAEYDHQKAENDWPADRCEACIRHGINRIGGSACCQSYGHHVYSFCLHCGNDERRGGWTYR
jgi:hypothetical protein